MADYYNAGLAREVERERRRIKRERRIWGNRSRCDPSRVLITVLVLSLIPMILVFLCVLTVSLGS
jgi:hypothetical protein